MLPAPDAPPGFLHDAVLLTSELVTNAVTHSGGGFKLGASYDRLDGRLRVEVANTSSVLPELGNGDRDRSVGGHGLRIVDTVAA